MNKPESKQQRLLPSVIGPAPVVEEPQADSARPADTLLNHPVALTIVLNGTERIVPSGCTIAQLLVSLQMNPRFLAVERNGALVPRAEHASCPVECGDQIEIVTLVGGG